MKSKRGFEFSFGWLFAVIVGAVILFLAIYTVTRLIQTQRTVQDTELGKELGIILNPLETSLETAKVSFISLPQETRIFNDCSLQGTFGVQKISIAARLSFGSDWQTPGFPSSFNNKYLFSQDVIEGKEYIVFSKPFEMPFSIANLIYIFPKKESYCLIDPPREIENEMNDLGIEQITISSSASLCPPESKKVCFKSSGCDIDVTLDISGKIRGTIKKKFIDRVYFDSSALFYAALFSSPTLYECQLQRLMHRASEISWIYYDKNRLLSTKNCASNLENDLALYSQQTFSLNSSLDMTQIIITSENIGRKNNDLSCKLF